MTDEQLRLLGIYLNDHYLGASAGVPFAARTARNHRGTPAGPALRTLADDISDGPEALDVDQLDLAVEFVRDVADYAEDSTVEDALDQDQPLGRFIAHVLNPDTVGKPPAPYAKAVEQWEEVETFVDSRLREE